MRPQVNGLVHRQAVANRVEKPSKHLVADVPVRRWKCLRDLVDPCVGLLDGVVDAFKAMFCHVGSPSMMRTMPGVSRWHEEVSRATEDAAEASGAGESETKVPNRSAFGCGHGT